MQINGNPQRALVNGSVRQVMLCRQRQGKPDPRSSAWLAGNDQFSARRLGPPAHAAQPFSGRAPLLVTNHSRAVVTNLKHHVLVFRNEPAHDFHGGCVGVSHDVGKAFLRDAQHLLGLVAAYRFEFDTTALEWFVASRGAQAEKG